MSEEENTPPRGGARYTLGKTRDGRDRTLVDLGSVVERIGDKVDEMYQEWPDMKAGALAWPRIEGKLDVALKPTIITRPMRAAVYAAAAAVIIQAVAVVLVAAIVVSCLGR